MVPLFYEISQRRPSVYIRDAEKTTFQSAMSPGTWIPAQGRVTDLKLQVNVALECSVSLSRICPLSLLTTLTPSVIRHFLAMTITVFALPLR